MNFSIWNLINTIKISNSRKAKASDTVFESFLPCKFPDSRKEKKCLHVPKKLCGRWG